MKKETVEEIKNNTNQLSTFLTTGNVKEITELLDNMGRLEKDFDFSPLLKCINHPNKKVRTLVVKNLAKLKNLELIELFTNILSKDAYTDVRREAVSALGRMRDKSTVIHLLSLLRDKDPEVVLQAIRGLLVFKNDELIRRELIKLKDSQNEIVRKIINIEFNDSKNTHKKHAESPDFLKNLCVFGDVIDFLKEVPDESIHLTFTSPPYYNARDYSIYGSYEEYLEFLSNVFKDIHRITKEGRFLIVNTSPIIIPRAGRKYSSTRYPIPYDLHNKIVSNGWDFIDDIVWVKSEASVMNRNGGFFQHRKPLTYKPNARTESVMVYRKKTNKLIDWNIDQYSLDIINSSKIEGKYETSNVWLIEPSSDKKHSAVFPEELCKRVISFYSFMGDLVFDPFGGRGTLGKAAMKLNRNYLMTEIDENYFEAMKTHLTGNIISDEDKVNLEQKFVSLDEFIKNKSDIN